ncbi:MarR family transcriptional regulator [Microbacterium sp. A8/3-1]|uniref:MarR family transcriptional regulator n=1 Tax=Microbacterium sp. A8/3-1 TaxID=3160749 RepID=A0AAU7VZ37_9MICO
MMTVDDSDGARARFIEAVATQWRQLGSVPMDGRVLAFLIIAEQEIVSSAELAAGLGVSQGAISASTRNLVASGAVRRVWVAGDRSHYFAVQDDPLGSMFKAGVPNQAALEKVFRPEADLDPHLTLASRTRLRNAADYYAWFESRREALADEWEAYKASRPPLEPED